MKVCFETFGCRLNKAEALQMEAEYLDKGWALTDKHSDADLFVVRGCSVTARAQSECEKLIAHLKRHYPNTPVRTCGCLNVDAASSPRQSDKTTFPNRRGEDAASTPLPTRTARAYLKVQDGCSGKCTFCIVPKFRGNSVSVPFTDLLDRAKRFIDAGYHEIVVTGCNLSLYASENKRLPDLVSALADLTHGTSACRIRLGSLEPGDCALETIRTMSEHDNVCRFLHVPIQSGSNRILMAMKRPYLVRDVEALVTAARKYLPNCGLGCDLMTGFPDESEADFIMTRGLIERLPFNNAHIFPFSERPGTLAAAFGGSIPKSVRSSRAHSLSHQIKSARKRYIRSFIGKTVEIVVESEEKTIGWTSEYVRCEAVGHAPRKSIVRVFVNRVDDDSLYGKISD